MTKASLPIRSSKDVSRGIVLTLLSGAPADIRNDQAVQQALASNGRDAWNNREAFFVRSERDRLLIVANTVDGLAAAVVELLETAGYEVLGMGPNWTHVPKINGPLVFDLQRSGRPSFYIRNLAAMSGQASAGYGTLFPTATLELHASDEPVATSHNRWSVGARIMGQSMPSFPGHALNRYHANVAAQMRETGSHAGFLAAKTELGLDAARPPAADENRGYLWVNRDQAGHPGHGKVFASDGQQWRERPPSSIAHLDLTVPLVRNILLEDLKRRSETHFAAHPDEVFIFGCEPEDGGVDDETRLRWQHDSRWYPDYLKRESVPFSQPYVLHGFRGLNQPRETWDPASRSDIVFGCANWLLREYDKWMTSRPQAERVTADSRAKSQLVRCSLYSYNQHDVPPNFNLDPRVRIMVAGFPKHRGRGKWKRVQSNLDIAAAFKKLLPREPSASYRILSFAYYHDLSAAGIPSAWSASPERILDDLKSAHRAGMRGMTYETDFNFGKHGLGYYLLAKSLWNVHMSVKKLDRLRDRWLQRAFGNGWREMKSYYDFLLPENFQVNGPNSWARAVRFIDAAQRKIDPTRLPDVQRRLDDLKQYWYFHYLLQSGWANRRSPELREFIWKGQQSYMVATNAVVRKYFADPPGRVLALDKALPVNERHGRATYTHAETARWWKRVLEFWPLKEVTQFNDATLADGKRASEIDLNDLVRVKEFAHLTHGQPFLYNSSYMKQPRLLTVAKRGELVGFKLFWPSRNTRNYEPRDVTCRIERWEPGQRAWRTVTDPNEPGTASKEMAENFLKTPLQVAEVRHQAASAGVFRMTVGRGGNLARLTSLGFDLTTGRYTTHPAHTFEGAADGLTQSGIYLYLPKGTRSFDFEMTDTNPRTITFHRGLPTKALAVSRKVKITTRDTHRIALQSEEAGTVVRIDGNNFRFPHVYSVPSRWAKSPAELLIPRSVARADGLTIAD